MASRATGAWWLAFVTAMLVECAASEGGAAESRMNVRTRSKHTQRLEAALQAAVARMETPSCATVLDEFRDIDGRTLREGLAAESLTVSQHAARLFFYDGSHNDTCHRREPVAYTKPGSRTVLLCQKRFMSLSYSQPRWAEATLIHEILHTMGLGENPPTSAEITHHVIARCHQG